MPKAKRQLLICVNNDGFEASLVRRKFYEALPDAAAARRGFTRIIDESGEDYLYPSAMFVAAALPAAVRRAVLQAA
jgi:hypothetical protein